MRASAYYKILRNKIDSMDGLTSSQKDRLNQNLNTLFTLMVLKFLQLNIPPFLFVDFVNDLKALSVWPNAVPIEDKRMHEFVLKYVKQIPDYSERFEEYMEDQPINSLLEVLKE